MSSPVQNFLILYPSFYHPLYDKTAKNLPFYVYFKVLAICIYLYYYDTKRWMLYEDYLKEGYIMAYVINDSCISCGACEGTCPVGAISEGDAHFEIKADECLSCGACADGCPVGAIEAE